MTSQLGLALGGKVLEADYIEGNENGASNPTQTGSLQEDMLYEVSAAVNYACNDHFSASLAYTFNLGDNALHSLPANLGPSCRSFQQQLISLGLKYQF